MWCFLVLKTGTANGWRKWMTSRKRSAWAQLMLQLWGGWQSVKEGCLPMKYAAKSGPGFSMSPLTSWIKSQVLVVAETHMVIFTRHSTGMCFHQESTQMLPRRPCWCEICPFQKKLTGRITRTTTRFCWMSNVLCAGFRQVSWYVQFLCPTKPAFHVLYSIYSSQNGNLLFCVNTLYDFLYLAFMFSFIHTSVLYFSNHFASEKVGRYESWLWMLPL